MGRKPSFKDAVNGIKVPVLKLLPLWARYKAGGLSAAGLIIAIILTVVAASVCSAESGSEGCAEISSWLEAVKR